MSTLSPTLGDDFLIGSPLEDSLFGYPLEVDGEASTADDEQGDDRLYGLAGEDFLAGDGGEDTLYGGEDDDRVFGDAGDDRLLAGDGDDTVGCGAGDDFAVGGSGQDLIGGTSGDDRVYGQDGNDRIFGGSQVFVETNPEDAQFAGGRDKLYGGAGNDYLYGGNDNDILVGGAGRDWLRGGQGADRFMFRDDFGDDRVADFQPGRDILDFRGQGLSAASFAYSVVDALGDGSADDLLITVAGLGSVALIRTDQSDLTATNLVF